MSRLVSSLHYVKCLGDSSYLKHAFTRTGPEFQPDVFTLNKAEAVKLTLAEAARFGYPEGDPIYKLIPCEDRSRELQLAIIGAKAALVGDSNDAEHDALVSLIEALGEGTVPECDCDERSWKGERHDSACPCSEWEEEP